MKYLKCLSVGFIFLLIGINESSAQNLLSRNITLTVNRQRLDNVLEILSNKGDFYFSYSSSIVKKDSLVSLNVVNRSVQDILRMLFNNSYEFRESGNYIIIRKAPIHLILVTQKAATVEKNYQVSGFVYDEQSGAAINEASIYEKKLLASTMTNDNGYFKLKLKSSKASVAELTVSKELYIDTTVTIETRHNQEVTITLMPIEKGENETITPQDLLLPDSLKPRFNSDVYKTLKMSQDSAQVEKTGMGRFLLSAKQKVQTLNLKNFFTDRPFQVSLVPGVGTHGKMGAQVVNNFSLNIFGGYTGGTNGVELGGIFNINKKNAQYFQAGGIFNVVGGTVKGVQMAGINNTVLDSVAGFQAAGINNMVKGNLTGFQIAGIYNHVSDSVKGMQVGGIANFSRRKVSGVQVAGIINFSNKETSGAQFAGIFNYSKRLNGLQVGLINICDTSNGYSIGLINIVLKGYHKLSFSTNETLEVNAAFKTGNSKLYSILMGGLNTGTTSKIYSFGYGLGSELGLNKRKTITLNPELSAQYLYLGSWDYMNILNKFHLNLNVKLGKYVSLFAGPSYNVYISDQRSGIAGYKYPIQPNGYKVHVFGDEVTGWFGWNAGISFF